MTRWTSRWRFERDFFPIYAASSKLQSWDIFACVSQVLAVLDPVPDPLPESVVRQRRLMPEDDALRAIHLAESEAERDRARERLTFDEASVAVGPGPSAATVNSPSPWGGRRAPAPTG